MEKMTITTDVLREAKLSSETLNIVSTLSALNEIATNFRNIRINASSTDKLQYISDVLTQVVECFGGTVDGVGKSTLTINVTQDDIDNGYGYVKFLTEPLMTDSNISSAAVTIKQLD